MAATAFGSRLRELRDQAGLTQQQLADKARASLGGIADLEQGRNKPSWEMVLKLADALGVDCTAFESAGATNTKPRSRGRPAKAKGKK